MTTKRKSRRKYEQGERIHSLDVLFEQEFIIVHGKVYHRGWFLSWSGWLIINYMKRGIYKAVPIAERGGGRVESTS